MNVVIWQKNISRALPKKYFFQSFTLEKILQSLPTWKKKLLNKNLLTKKGKNYELGQVGIVQHSNAYCIFRPLYGTFIRVRTHLFCVFLENSSIRCQLVECFSKYDLWQKWKFLRFLYFSLSKYLKCHIGKGTLIITRKDTKIVKTSIFVENHILKNVRPIDILY